MSPRGLDFIRRWTAANIDTGLAYRRRVERVHVLALTCRMEAGAASIPLQEIQDEVGDLERAFDDYIDGRPTRLTATGHRSTAASNFLEKWIDDNIFDRPWTTGTPLRALAGRLARRCGAEAVAEGLTVKAMEDDVGRLSDFMAEAVGRRRNEG
jgi:hypothetical protein